MLALLAGLVLTVPQPTRTVLPNGLRVIVMEDHSSPMVAVQVAYHVGSKDETAGTRGLAHFFEHLMFRGTRAHGPGMFDEILDDAGGENNAFTTEDMTAYHEVMPAESLRVALELESDRMRNLVLEESIIAPEREVVKEEKRLSDESSPLGRAHEAFRTLAFTTHPYAWTPTGTVADLDHASVATIRAFYDRFYRPENAVLVVVGDVNAREVHELAAKLFSGVARGEPAARARAAEPEQKKLREKTLSLDIQMPMLVGGYHVGPLASPDTAALEVLGVILSGGESSRLHRVLVKKQKLCVYASGGTETFEDPGLFLVYAGYLPDTDPQSVREALLTEIERVGVEGVGDEEVVRARNQLLAGHVFSLETVEGKASSLAAAEILEGDFQKFVDETTKYDAVDAASVKNVAKKYLQRSNLTLVRIEPKESGK